MSENERLRLALEHCVRALAEYERKPGGDLRPFLLGALDFARAALSSPAPQDDVIGPRALLERAALLVSHPEDNMTRNVAGELMGRMTVAKALRVLLGAPTRG